MQERNGTTSPVNDARNDGTPTSDSAAALHWAAAAIGLAEARTQQGNPLTDTERAAFDRYQNAARAHGFTHEQVLDYLDNTLRPALAVPRPGGDH